MNSKNHLCFHAVVSRKPNHSQDQGVLAFWKWQNNGFEREWGKSKSRCRV